MKEPDIRTEILHDAESERVVLGRAVITDIQVFDRPWRRDRELLVYRIYRRLVAQTDVTATVPEWVVFARARQGCE